MVPYRQVYPCVGEVSCLYALEIPQSSPQRAAAMFQPEVKLLLKGTISVQFNSIQFYLYSTTS